MQSIKKVSYFFKFHQKILNRLDFKFRHELVPMESEASQANEMIKWTNEIGKSAPKTVDVA